MGIANYITFGRVFISPIFLWIYIYHQSLGITPIQLPYYLLILMATSEFSDAIDGYLARKFNQVSDFGKIFDPIADSLSRVTVFLTFTQPPISLPLFLAILFLYRDSVTNTLRMACALKGIALGARMSGKIKAIIQAIAAFCVLFLMIPASLGYISNDSLQLYSCWIVAITACYSIFSGIDYIVTNGHYILGIMNHTRPHKSDL